MAHRGRTLVGVARATATFGAVSALCAGAICPAANPVSEEGAFVLEEHGMATSTGYLPSVWAYEPVLAGEVTCPTLVCNQQDCAERAPADGGVAACFAHTVTGATVVGGCLTFDAEGVAIWALEPIACQPDVDAGVPLVGDRFLFGVVGPEDVVPEQAPKVEALAEAFMVDGGVIAEPATPADFAAPRDELFIVEGGLAPVSAALIDVESGARVAVEGDSLVLEDVAPTPASVRVQGEWLLEADPGATAALRLVTNTARFDVATIEGVPLSAAASMSLFAFYWTDDEHPGATAPAAVHALVHDAAGRVLDGAPVEWTLVQGDLAISDLYRELGGIGGDDGVTVRRGPWMLVADACRPPSQRVGTTTALLRARLGELEQDVRLTWTLVPDVEGTTDWIGIPRTAATEDEGFTRDPACPPGPACGCASAPANAPAPLLAAGAVVVLASVCARAKRRVA